MNVASLAKLTKIGEGSCATSRDLTAPAVGQVRGRMQARIGEHFSTAAQRVFGAKVRRYAESLQDASREVAKSCYSECVSATHVRIASTRLSIGRLRASGFRIAMGGVLLGASVGNVLSVISAKGPVSCGVFVATSLVGLAGMYSLVKGLHAT